MSVALLRNASLKVALLIAGVFTVFDVITNVTGDPVTGAFTSCLLKLSS